jgi:hypothetical protein
LNSRTINDDRNLGKPHAAPFEIPSGPSLSFNLRLRGSALLIVIVVSFLIATLIMAIFVTQGATRQALLRSHNELQARQKLTFELANMALGDSAPEAPKWLDVEIHKDIDQSEFLTPAFASDPFRAQADLNEAIEISGLPELEGYPGHRYLQYRLSAGKPTLAVVSENLGFALLAFATNSVGDSIDIRSLRSWRNPVWDTPTAESDYSGTSPNILAIGPVSIEDFPYGNIYQADLRGDSNNIGPTDGSSAGIIFKSDVHFRGIIGLDPMEYRKLLEDQIATVFDEMTDIAERSNRAPLINEEIKIADTLGMFFSQAAAPRELKRRLTLKEAQGYFLPAIPTIKPMFSIVYHIIIHSPARPDGNLNNDFAKFAQNLLTQILNAVKLLDKVTEALDKLIREVQKLRKEIDKICKCKNIFETPHCCAARGAAWLAYYSALAALELAKVPVETAKYGVMILISPITHWLRVILAASGQIEAPKTRNEEKNFERDHNIKLTKAGMPYWAYRAAFNGMVDVVVNLLTGRLDKVGESLGNKVVVVFFGQPNKAQNFRFPDGNTFVSHATWNVPPGRTFYYSTGLEIHGDLWLSQGSTMVVKGNLKLLKGDQTPDRRNHPSGTLHLEEGSTLIVDGDFSAQGEKGRGSVLVSGSLGSLYGISSGVLAEGNVELPNGVVSAVALSKLKPTQAMMEPMVNEVAPNLSKSAGPFHSRLPYIAMYATTFQYIGPPISLPVSIPMNFPNFHVPIFRGFSYLYTPTLNLEMGENLLTHCDWWGTGGEGRPPILTKPEAAALVEANPRTQSPAVRAATAVSSVDKRLALVGEKEVDRWANALLIGLLKEWSNALAIDTGIPMVKISSIAGAVLKKFFEKYYNLDNRERDLENALPVERKQLTVQMTQLWSQVDLVFGRNNDRYALAQECQGALVYAGKDLSVGSGDPLSAGLFIADGQVTLGSELTIGSAVSLHGGIEAKDFFFYPAFTQASLFRPLAESSEWMARARSFKYGAKMSDNRQPLSKTLPVGAWRPRLSTVARGHR